MKHIMGFFAILQLCFIFGNASNIGRPVTVKNCGMSSDQSRIGGKLQFWAREGLLPWTVVLMEKSGEIFRRKCAGSVLNERWILTAAHCINYPDDPDKYFFLVGTNRLSKTTAKHLKQHKISKIIVHEAYNQHNNDIALLKTEYPIDFAGSEGLVNGICLPEMDQEFFEGRAMVPGWVRLMHNGAKYFILRSTIVLVRSAEDCLSYGTHMSNMICSDNPGLGPCQTDPGAPLVIWPYGKAVLLGMTSSATVCGSESEPGVYTKVASYVDWIEHEVNSN